MFLVKFIKFIAIGMTVSFPIEGYYYSNYTRPFLSSVVEQWKLVHLISVFQYMQYLSILSSTCLN